jgi:hypothetical protein
MKGDRDSWVPADQHADYHVEDDGEEDQVGEEEDGRSFSNNGANGEHRGRIGERELTPA